jgi:hypothetical protein
MKLKHSKNIFIFLPLIIRQQFNNGDSDIRKFVFEYCHFTRYEYSDDKSGHSLLISAGKCEPISIVFNRSDYSIHSNY